MRTTPYHSRRSSTPFPFVELEQERVEFKLPVAGKTLEGIGTFLTRSKDNYTELYIEYSMLVGRMQKIIEIPVNEDFVRLIVEHPGAKAGASQSFPRYELIAPVATDDASADFDGLHKK